MKRVVLESPYAGNVEKNLAYAKLCIKDMLLRGEAPIASHLLFTQPGILDDTKPEERKLGINAGLAWVQQADYSVFYIDLGMSNGMKAALEYSEKNGHEFIIRTLPTEKLQELNANFRSDFLVD